MADASDRRVVHGVALHHGVRPWVEAAKKRLHHVGRPVGSCNFSADGSSYGLRYLDGARPASFWRRSTGREYNAFQQRIPTGPESGPPSLAGINAHLPVSVIRNQARFPTRSVVGVANPTRTKLCSISAEKSHAIRSASAMPPCSASANISSARRHLGLSGILSIAGYGERPKGEVDLASLADFAVLSSSCFNNSAPPQGGF